MADSHTPSVPLRHVVLPAEHGGWAFLGEPVLLGLAVAWSGSGVWIALAAIAGFLARRPLRLWMGDARRGRSYPRTRLARAAFVTLALVAAFALAAAVVSARGPVLLALGVAAPLAALALAMDLGQRGREAATEVIGPLALAATAPAIALAAGWAPAPAFALWGVLASRVVPSIVYVRARLRLDRGEPAGVALALGMHAVAIACVSALAARGVAPWSAAAAMIVLFARAAWQLSPARPRLSIPLFGLTEVLSGLVVVAATAIGSLAAR